ncbi:D-alanyl-D-alanine carboxypeptidase/D-alanyl-D-alanine endopeptidase [Corynebacterium gerontici]|uniref:D-alanyl-D-alanine carboxypeptidase DacB n=1 Tax=Corynebacterium gerontici TaxID=2079234 RepID=A0A3G6J2M7_9CORY|nr:D-alanyl-D-alanine carboxypeptidase/D-alanyl-D-alanine-endopeptidase [Corynebacterium gerontici]AZA10650.1 D-alanyl-D-alanine carboxypeptidase DacB precursor [Corynebacterium gerontici]
MKKAQWWTALLGAGVVVAMTAGAGVWLTQYNALEVDPPAHIEAPQALVNPVSSDAPLDPALSANLSKLVDAPALGNFGIQVADANTGEVIFERASTQAMIPASSTKMLSAAAALLKLGANDVIRTKVLQISEDTVVIQGSGDVWLTQDRIKDLAAQIQKSMPQVSNVLVDVSAWPGEKILPGWDPQDVDGGFVAPLEPLMINQGRLGAATGDVPRSHTPALDVAQALAQQLGAPAFGYTQQAQGEEIASTQSPTLERRIELMMEDSDNVMAEAIARELDADDPTGATLATLQEAGLDTSGITLADNCGLSLNNRITPVLLSQISTKAVQEEQLRPLLATLPIAGASGTLSDRFAGMDGRGWVRAKTGTLTKVAALAGVVPSSSGHMLSFAMISNGADVDGARKGMDQVASALRDA